MLDLLHFPAWFWPQYQFTQTTVETLGVLLTLALTTFCSADRLMGRGCTVGTWVLRGSPRLMAGAPSNAINNVGPSPISHGNLQWETNEVFNYKSPSYLVFQEGKASNKHFGRGHKQRVGYAVKLVEHEFETTP